VGESADPSGYGKSWQREAFVESALRAADVKDLFYLSFPLCRVDDGCSLPVDAADRRGGFGHGFDSWGRDFTPKIPSRALLPVLESLAHKLDFVPAQKPSEEAL
jgi:hypothetical protein